MVFWNFLTRLLSTLKRWWKGDPGNWTIQVTLTKRDDNNKPFQCRTVFWAENAPDLPTAYKQAEILREQYPDARFGACVRGHHPRLF